jgi:exodeoxyribonuclease V beta subunit
VTGTLQAAAYEPVDLTAELPSGTTVLEASAGTGKTWTIAGLVTRYVAEGRARIDQVLAVTFGVAATSELRTRVRERLVEVRDALDRPAACATHRDPVVRHLGDGAPDEVALRRERIATALADFDAATVATVHELCQQVLAGLGVAADTDPHVELVESLSDVVDDVVDDLYVRHVTTRRDGEPALDLPLARALARVATDDRQAVLLPDLAEVAPRSEAHLRRRYAQAVREELARRTRAARVLGFDDLLVRVRDALADDVTGPVARERLRSRFAVVLVDEFQDTDPVQWEVLRLAFHGERTLVLIGDPKQAIYAFRGADVHAYLAAAGAADHRRTLGTNWRSDESLLAGLGSLFRGAALGDADIVVRPVDAGQEDCAVRPAAAHPVRLRQVRRDGHQLTKTGLLGTATARTVVAQDVAAEVVRTLAAGLTHTPRGGQERPLEARDVAVLVPTRATAEEVRRALSAVGVPSVFTGTTSVFGSDAARDWLTLLEGLEQPHRSAPVRRASLTTLVGRTATEVDAQGEAGDERWASTLREWAEELSASGVAALFQRVGADTDLAARVLRRTDGERVLTDLRHVAEALHQQALHDQLTLSGLVGWLREEVARARTDRDQERARRLDTDASSVQITTVHTSKGLEFPVVLVPFGWDLIGGGGGGRSAFPRAHDAEGRRTVHVGGPDSPGFAESARQEEADEAGEDLRLLYVATTRAVSRLVLWWAPTWNTRRSPLHRLLLGADPAQDQPLEVPVPEDDDEVRARFDALAAAGSGLAVEVVGQEGPPPAAPPGTDGTAPRLAVSVLGRPLDDGWRRTSYSGLTRAAHELVAHVVSEPDVHVVTDEEEDEEGLAAVEPAPHEDDEQLRRIPSPMSELEGGAAFGTLVHDVLERAVLDPADPLGSLTTAAVAATRWLRGSAAPEVLAEALLPSVTTPWGAVSDGRALADFGPSERVAELAFELPLAGGDRPRPGPPPLLGEVARLVREHLPAGDPVRPYAAMLHDPLLREETLRGYLTGSLDLVVRVGEPDAPRYVVVDHKTNRLAPPDEPLTAWHYRRTALDDAVRQAHYPLQAMLYAVALHRFLRWRQPGYHPEVHLGGVAYLFLRGMVGPSLPVRADGFVPGVWSWTPPASFVVALSELLAGGEA